MIVTQQRRLGSASLTMQADLTAHKKGAESFRVERMAKEEQPV
jgi:hypothetical protein